LTSGMRQLCFGLLATKQSNTHFRVKTHHVSLILFEWPVSVQNTPAGSRRYLSSTVLLRKSTISMPLALAFVRLA
jgi:hypothetical protein